MSDSFYKVFRRMNIVSREVSSAAVKMKPYSLVLLPLSDPYDFFSLPY